MKIEDIVFHADLKTRKICDETVANYAERLAEGDKFPPVEVFTDGKTIWLVDGFHRVMAHKKIDRNEIDVIVHKGTLRDAEFYTFGVNYGHGRSRTIPEKKAILFKMFEDVEYGMLSLREIAKIVKVSHTFVASVKKSLEKPKPATPTKPAKPSTTAPAVKADTPKETPPPEDYDPKEDQISELSVTNQQLAEENTKLKDKDLVVSEEQAVVLDEITGLRNQIKGLEAELKAVKNSRDQFQNKNLELIKQVKYLENKIKKSGS
jgi:hypothetical protein